MANLSNIKADKKTKPFVDTDELRIEVPLGKENKITIFIVTKKKPRPVTKEFKVIGDNPSAILKAWQQVEEFTKELK